MTPEDDQETPEGGTRTGQRLKTVDSRHLEVQRQAGDSAVSH